jgi:hypothetical protein
MNEVYNRPWEAVMAEIQHAPAAPEQSALPPVYYYPAPPRRSSGLSLVAALLLAICLLVLAVAAVFVLVVASLTGWGDRAVGEAGQRAAAVVGSAADSLEQAGQDARDRFDPSHPPRGALPYDTEIQEFLRLNVGQTLPDGRTRVFTLAAIKSREGGERPELSRYVVVHSELRQANETRVLGLTVRRDPEPRDDYLYQGEAFRLSGQVYKINWISPERQQVAVIQLRDPDRANLPLKFVDEEAQSCVTVLQAGRPGGSPLQIAWWHRARRPFDCSRPGMAKGGLVLLDHRRRTKTDEKRQAGRQGRQVVQLPQARDPIWDEVQGREHVQQGQPQHKLRVERYSLISRQVPG